MSSPALPERHWSCERCPSWASTRDAALPHHRCRGMAGLMVPLVEVGTRAKVEAVERGDWVGRELVATDATGRPVMAVVLTRDDGQDTTVYAPTAHAGKEDIHG